MIRKVMCLLLTIVVLFCCFSIEIVSADDSIGAGISSFQTYINNTLPCAYLGSLLTVNGVFNDAAKIAAVKLVQYTLNQSGASLTINGGYDNVFDYELTCIWCNRCLDDLDINKF